MYLKDLITALESEDPTKVLPIGFWNPHSYRGDYSELAFELVRDIPVGVMLEKAKSAMGATYQGYKGGLYKMGEYTSVNLAEYGDSGEELNPVTLAVMLGRPLEEIGLFKDLPKWKGSTERKEAWPEEEIKSYDQ